jgi:hypothetical protein
VFRNESKDGRRRAHFAHKHDCHNCSDGCNYIKKYGGKGESPEHLQAKLWFGLRLQPRIVFCVECEQVCGNYIRTVEVPKDWTYKTEQRLTMTDGEYIWADGAFIDESGVVQLVVEVKHTHGTTDDKLKWLQNQAFEFFEVNAKDVQNSCNGVVPIINQKNDHRLCGECEKRISETLDAQKKHDDHVREAEVKEAMAKKKHDDHVRETLKREAEEKEAKFLEAKRNEWISWGYKHSLASASCNIKNNFACVMKSVKQKGLELQWASDKLKGDKEVVMAAIAENGYALKFASDALKNDKELVMVAVAHYGRALRFASDTLKGDKEVVMPVVTREGRLLEHASDELKNDKEVVMIAVAQNGRALQYASDKLKGDNEVVKAAVSNNLIALQYATKTLCNDKDLAKMVLGMDIRTIHFFSVQIALDYIKTNVGRKHVFIKNMPDSLRNNKNIVSIFVKHTGNSLEHASDDLRDDVDIVKLAIDNWPHSVYFASERVKNVLQNAPCGQKKATTSTV